MEQLNLDISSAPAATAGVDGAIGKQTTNGSSTPRDGGFIGKEPINDSPLAARMRPESFDDYAGQRHILDLGKLLRRAIDADRFTSIVLSGPPGSGKTTLAELIAKRTRAAFVRLSGVASSVADIRRETAAAVTRKAACHRNTILFIDEIHRFNRAQQDVLLPDVENGNVRMIGATTMNPNFHIVGPLLSRSLVFQLEPLSEEDVQWLLRRALTDDRGLGTMKVDAAPDALAFFADVCEGDARKALTAMEIAATTTLPDDAGRVWIDLATAEASIQKRAVVYGDDGHYDTISAFIKSMRGSDPDAAVYWLAKMLHAGEDPMFIARRIVIFASEDVGNADPRALSLAVNAMRAVEMIGMPEARIILSQTTTYCATAPKSNAAYQAVREALSDVEGRRTLPVPVHLRDPHSSSADARGEYKYPHDHPHHFVAQDYLGVDKTYYQPVNVGYEVKIAERVRYWASLREKSTRDDET